MRHYFPVLNPLAIIVCCFAVILAIPLGVSHLEHDGATRAFNKAILITFSAGAALWLLTRGGRKDLRPRDGFLLVALVWVMLPMFGALPLLFQLKGLSMTDAYFESVSGLTATGATLLSGLDDLPVSINFWRTFLHWLGGMGVIVLAVAILPLLGIGGRQLFKAETPTPIKDQGLTPRIAETAKGLWGVYVLLTLACMLSLYLAGMRGWDVPIHAFSVMGLGGFSSHDASLGYFDSLAIELVVIAFALMSGINYATHFLALHKFSLRPYLSDRELPMYLGLLALSILGLSLYLTAFGTHADFLVTLREVAFHSVSLATSLGFAIGDYTAWPMFAQLWMLFLGSFIACSGSTGGGIKLMRAIILYKQVFREVTRSIHPNVVQPVRLGGQTVPDTILHAVLAFSFIYMCSIVSLTLFLSATGLELVTAFSAVVACLNNTGPGLNVVGPAGNYSGLSDLQTWVLSFTMLLGRLELFTLLVVLTPIFWRR